jgi:hypothetical protein
MQVNIAYLIESTIYEKVVQATNGGNYLPEFQRAYPDVFMEKVEITSEIVKLDKQRKTAANAVQTMNQQGVDEGDPLYSAVIDAGWNFYKNEVDAFYKANKPKLDTICEKYKTFRYREILEQS